MTLLCVARCRPSGPREAAPGYRLCWPCRDNYRRHLVELQLLAPDLEAALSNAMNAVGTRVSGTRAGWLELNQHAARIRWQIHHDMVTTVRLVIEERDWRQYPANDIAPMAAWLRVQVDWLAAHPSAGERAAEAASWPGMARGAIHPNPPKIVTIGPCVRPSCPGVLTAVVRPQDSMLPSVITCSWWTELETKPDDEKPHVWSADQWHALGRQMSRA